MFPTDTMFHNPYYLGCNPVWFLQLVETFYDLFNSRLPTVRRNPRREHLALSSASPLFHTCVAWFPISCSGEHHHILKLIPSFSLLLSGLFFKHSPLFQYWTCHRRPRPRLPRKWGHPRLPPRSFRGWPPPIPPGRSHYRYYTLAQFQGCSKFIPRLSVRVTW